MLLEQKETSKDQSSINIKGFIGRIMEHLFDAMGHF